MDLANFVLRGFNEKEVEIIREEVKLTSEAIESMLEFGIDKTMNKFNSINLLEN